MCDIKKNNKCVLIGIIVDSILICINPFSAGTVFIRQNLTSVYRRMI